MSSMGVVYLEKCPFVHDEEVLDRGGYFSEGKMVQLSREQIDPQIQRDLRNRTERNMNKIIQDLLFLSIFLNLFHFAEPILANEFIN